MTSSGPVTWIQSTGVTAGELTGQALVAGNDSDGSPLWVVRGTFGIEKVPGKFSVNRQQAYIPWEGKEILVDNFEVCCAPPGSITWTPTSTGSPLAVIGGWDASGEPLYIGRAPYSGSLTPGVIQPLKESLTISYGGELFTFQSFDLLCSI